MTVDASISPRSTHAVAFAILALLLGGCASGDVRSSIFVDPSRYDLYDCPQLATARVAAEKRVADLQSLIAKADTGFAGPVVSGLAYKTDFSAAVAQRDLIDQKMAANNCPAQPPPVAESVRTPAPKGRTRR